jgi:hypothetical protein
LLDALRVTAASKPKHDCLFVGLNGHEIGLLGIGEYIKRRPTLLT